MLVGNLEPETTSFICMEMVKQPFSPSKGLVHHPTETTIKKQLFGELQALL